MGPDCTAWSPLLVTNEHLHGQRPPPATVLSLRQVIYALVMHALVSNIKQLLSRETHGTGVGVEGRWGRCPPCLRELTVSVSLSSSGFCPHPFWQLFSISLL